MATATYGSTPQPTDGPTEDAVRAALATVDDPEIHKPITELGMVKSVGVGADGTVEVTVYLTVAGCRQPSDRCRASPPCGSALR